MKFSTYILTAPTALLLACASFTANAQTGWQACPSDYLAEKLQLPGGGDTNAPVQVEADTVEASRAEALFSGGVTIEQSGRLMEAEAIQWDRLANIATADEGATFADHQIALKSGAARYDFNRRQGSFNEVDYYFGPYHAQGTAESVEFEQDSGRSQLTGLSYSTCPRGEEAWQINAGQLDLNPETGRGVARDVKFSLGGVPVIYLPWLSFPINDQRQSGFLAPRLGYNSDNGADVTAPYYWNISPNQDMTINPRVVAKRGVMLGAEYRYLQPDHSGELNFQYLPHDRDFGEDRGSFTFKQRSQLADQFSTDLLYQYVSDDDYLSDFGNRLRLLNTTHLERRFDARYQSNNWQMLARVQGYQTLDEDLFADDRPYDRLPQLLYDGAWQRGPVNFALNAEAVYFDKSDDITGARFDIKPTISLPRRTPWGFITPKLSWRHTQYWLDDLESDEADDSPQRSAPIASLDSGLVFERGLKLGGTDYIQTLEPRAYLLYVPKRDQTSIPIFDSSEIDPGLAWLFLDNRFTGADRLGDAEQVSAAVTTRLLNASTGAERARASLGQIYYVKDREVTLPDENIDTDSRSIFIAEAQVSLGHGWSIGGGWQLNSDFNDTRRAAADLRYRSEDGKVLNLSHRYVAGELEQGDISGVWPVNERWRMLGRWNYSVRDSLSLEALAGVEYQDCCWALRVLGRHHRDDADEEAENSIMLEVELKGLSRIGSSIDNLLENAILGYRSPRQ